MTSNSTSHPRSIQPISVTMPILEVAENYPETIAVFNEFNMACPGCHISPYHTVADSAREYNLQLEELLQALNNVVNRI